MFSSLSYSFQKVSWKAATYRPSLRLIAVSLIGISVFLLGGGVYDILMNPAAIFPLSPGRFIFYYPRLLHEQILNESIGIMILYALGALGLLLIYQSTKYIRNPRQVSFILRIGVALILIAFVAVEAILYWKLNYTGS